MIRYENPRRWMSYEPQAITESLTNAKAAIIALTQMPFQRRWAEELQRVQLKREVAGTSRIEGAEFTQLELEEALEESPQELHTRSQRQAAAAAATYRWIAALPSDRPVDRSLILETHRRLVTGCDDDHCEPGKLRGQDNNVTFGVPAHRGVEGGAACDKAFSDLVDAFGTSFRDHDPLVQAHALHYYLAAMHPFEDGNGRTARAVEALLLQKLGLRDALFIAMSNHYYDEKTAYLTALNEVRAAGHDLTPFLVFALKGVEIQCRRLLSEIRRHVARALYRDTMMELFTRLESPRKRVMTQRHIQILNFLLEAGEVPIMDLMRQTAPSYAVKNVDKAQARDLAYLWYLEAINVDTGHLLVSINLDWPAQVTETEFFARTRQFAKAKSFRLDLPRPEIH